MITSHHRRRRAVHKVIWTCGALLAVALTGDRLRLSSSSADLLRFAHTFTTASERAIIDQAISEFERTHARVRVEQVIQNSETYQTIGWRLQFQGRKQPDVFFVWQGFKVNYAIEQKWVLDVSPYVSKQGIEQFVPAAVERRQAAIYFLPHSIDISNLIWYNRDVFAGANLTEPRTLAEWRAACAALRSRNVLPLAQGNRDLWPMGNFGAELIGQHVGPERMKALFVRSQDVSREDVNGLQTLLQLREEGCLDLPPLLSRDAVSALSDIDAKVLFLGGKSAQHVIGSWLMADIQDARSKGELKFEIGVAPVPAAQEDRDALTLVATGFMVNSATRNPKAAVEFVELLLSRRYQAEFAKLGNLSARRDASEFTNDPLVRRLLHLAADARRVVPPPDTGFRPEQANAFYETCARLLAGRLDLAGAAKFWNDEKSSLARKGL